METRHVVRAMLRFSPASTSTISTTLGSSSSQPLGLTARRALSSTATRYAAAGNHDDESLPPRPPTASTFSWPPQRPSKSSKSSPSSNSSPGSRRNSRIAEFAAAKAAAQVAANIDIARNRSENNNNPLNKAYPADNAAGWTMWTPDDFYKRHAPERPQGPPVPLRPATGKTIFVGGTIDPARAFKTVNSIVQRDRVRSDSVRQRYHERAGMKRKRLRMDRWRRRFKNGFKGTVHRVAELAAQGW